ncbi:phosphoenolpyruvate--protein phosphotransferase [Shewanella violacea]|uniref:Phosphoenolpyruvate-protein phosphotransferase n=1 Tax=Shewanella violacea (strain JCM 10179 / CIP 106290 / LMG 19151 / DSS12) TaxID=637905 RepID=D4ZJQ9_SHEVD|nr:phosphoenolpyruvate--protein phosphotransferase [Shewanella violacea]BAJ01908.1 phosphoenolpyruvate-protein phosphotransferase [Shewanella violacea DSS12]
MSISGIVVSSGVAFGQARILKQHNTELDYRVLPLGQIPAEQTKLSSAITQFVTSLTSSLQSLSPDCDNYQLIEADILLLEDEELIAQLQTSIADQQFTASVAVERVFTQHANQLRAMEDLYLADRAQDIACLASRLISVINGNIQHDLQNLHGPTILFAYDLTPAEFATLPLDKINGIVLKTGGLTSHTAILARSAGIPAMLNCDFDISEEAESLQDNQAIALDALSGVLHINPDSDVLTQLTQLSKKDKLRKAQLLKYKDQPMVTQDSHRVTLLANVGCLSEIRHLADVGADGIGLFRTEFMLMNASEMPTEEIQYRLYCDALQLLDGKIFTIRTLDIGADKELPCLSLPAEDNPALGLRGARYSLAHPELLKTQLRSVLRAANHGQIRLMFPMINQVEELDTIFDIIEVCKTELVDEEQGYGDLSYGIMIETPAAVLNLPSMLSRLDFISIGTNDLTQYTMAADRTNPLLTKAYPSLSPAILALIKMTINTAKSAGIPTSLCGELAANPNVAAILVGMGLDELSVSPSSLLELKSSMRNHSLDTYSQWSQQALSLQRLDELNDYVSHCN